MGWKHNSDPNILVSSLKKGNKDKVTMMGSPEKGPNPDLILARELPKDPKVPPRIPK
jgi:hypothetical protein